MVSVHRQARERTRQDMIDQTIYVAGVVCDMLRENYEEMAVTNNCAETMLQTEVGTSKRG